MDFNSHKYMLSHLFVHDLHTAAVYTFNTIVYILVTECIIQSANLGLGVI